MDLKMGLHPAPLKCLLEIMMSIITVMAKIAHMSINRPSSSHRVRHHYSLCWSCLFKRLPSICLSSCSVLMNLLPEPQPHSSREPSCRKACGGYNELGVYPGCPDLRPMTSSIKEVLHLSETEGPKPGTL